CTGCSRPQEQAQAPMPGPGMEPGAPPAGAATINQIGSTTVLPLAEKWREEFNKLHPEVNLAVSGGGSGAGIEALINKSAQIANASREIKGKEKDTAATKGVNPVEHLVAYDGIAVIVAKENPLKQISVQQLSDIYSGKVKKWDEVGAKGLGDIQIVNRDSSSGTYEAFKEMVVQLDGKDKDRDFAAGTMNQTSNEAVKTTVAQSKAAIGYVGLGYLDDTVKALPVVGLGEGAKAVAPSLETVQDKTYPVSRGLFMYTDGEPSGAIKDYMDFVKGDAGQALVEGVGYVPIRKLSGGGEAAPAAPAS
ncbi:MAG: phosphate ABC transporter substrate-binding protein, partial [Armatimonadetes bacterium]|nr:phosphate ABC transporter substrate-binding protein [Armatimonadota bacterium]